jgi:chromosome segregation ATPase
LTVNAAVKLNKKLMYVNSHQSCQVATYEKELQLKAVEIVSLNADLANKEMGTTQSHGKSCTEQELKKQQDLVRQLENQLTALREQHQQSLVAARQGHELVKKHMERKDEAEQMIKEMEDEIDTMRQQHETLRHEIDTVRDSKEEEKRQNEKKTLAWKEMVSHDGL